MLAARDVWPERIRPLRRVEYEALVERGLFQESRVELLCGSLVDMAPQGPRHADVAERLAARLLRSLPASVRVRVHSPLALSEDSEPEPDIAVVPAGDYRRAHPTLALLVVEIADASVLKDRGIKSGLYAMAGVPEYWIVNLQEDLIEAHRRPVAGRYEEVHRIGPTGVLAPADFPEVRIEAAEILQ